MSDYYVRAILTGEVTIPSAGNVSQLIGLEAECAVGDNESGEAWEMRLATRDQRDIETVRPGKR